MVTNNMPILAVRTLHEHGTSLIAVFRYGVGGAVGAGFAGKGELVLECFD